ncbi:MAG: tetratricopeptide repeat protein [Cyanobacteria bacterium]|nr:tetratricopeptide repeat protein [Cyanobacteriota bacterium]
MVGLFPKYQNRLPHFGAELPENPKGIPLKISTLPSEGSDSVLFTHSEPGKGTPSSSVSLQSNWRSRLVWLFSRKSTKIKHAVTLQEQGIHLALKEGNYIQAEILLKQSVAIQIRYQSQDPQALISPLTALAKVQQKLQKFDLAQENLQRVLSIAEETLGSLVPQVALTLGDLGSVAEDKNDLTQALHYLGRSAFISGEVFGTQHPQYCKSLIDLARLHQKTKNIDKAEENYLNALAVMNTFEKLGAFDPHHPMLLSTLNNLGSLYAKTGRYNLAEPLFIRMHGLQATDKNPSLAAMATTLNSLGTFAFERKDLDGASNHFIGAMVALEKAFGKDDIRLAYPLNQLSVIYLGDKKYKAAEPILRRTRAILETYLQNQRPGKNVASPEVMTQQEAKDALVATLLNLASLCADTKRLKEVERLLKQVDALEGK